MLAFGMFYCCVTLTRPTETDVFVCWDDPKSFILYIATFRGSQQFWFPLFTGIAFVA